ncbi:HD domain-containing protein, partial [archaeon]|nr:HD domain-containing protein [archaeon]
MDERRIRLPQNYVGLDEPIGGYEPVIDHPYIQRLRGVSQLDTVSLTYPGATGNRFVHALGTFHHGRNINETIRKKFHNLNKTERITLNVGYLTHDIGIPPQSHGSEYVLMAFGEPNHDVKSIDFLEEMESKIKKVKCTDFGLLL